VLQNEDDELNPVRRPISVFWSDSDGKCWETGVVKEKYLKVKFIVTYDFLVEAMKEDESVDPDVIENLLGKKAVNWRFK